jgi:hypothetical protein
MWHRAGLVKSVSQLRTLFFARGYFTLKIEATRSSETSILAVPTRPHIAEDGILQTPHLVVSLPADIFILQFAGHSVEVNTV